MAGCQCFLFLELTTKVKYFKAHGIFTGTLDSGAFGRHHQPGPGRNCRPSLHIWTGSQVIFLMSAEDNKDKKSGDLWGEDSDSFLKVNSDIVDLALGRSSF